MTKLHTDPADRDPAHHGTSVAAVTPPMTVPELEKPNYATTDIDPTPGGPRPLAATEPNYATTDIDPTPGSAPGDDVHPVTGGVAAPPAVGAGRPETRPLRGR